MNEEFRPFTKTKPPLLLDLPLKHLHFQEVKTLKSYETIKKEMQTFSARIWQIVLEEVKQILKKNNNKKLILNYFQIIPNHNDEHKKNIILI